MYEFLWAYVTMDHFLHATLCVLPDVRLRAWTRRRRPQCVSTSWLLQWMLLAVVMDREVASPGPPAWVSSSRWRRGCEQWGYYLRANLKTRCPMTGLLSGFQYGPHTNTTTTPPTGLLQSSHFVIIPTSNTRKKKKRRKHKNDHSTKNT